MKNKTLSLILTFSLAMASVCGSAQAALADTNTSATESSVEKGAPGEAPDGNPPEGAPGEAPDGMGPGGQGENGMGGPGAASADIEYKASVEINSADSQSDQTYESTSSDENALLIDSSEEVSVTNPTVTKSGDSDGGDSCK